jgi:hypothetical protein
MKNKKQKQEKIKQKRKKRKQMKKKEKKRKKKKKKKKRRRNTFILLRGEIISRVLDFPINHNLTLPQLQNTTLQPSSKYRHAV